MAHPGVDHLRPASRGAVAHAIAVGTEVGAALDHLARYPELRLPPVVALADSATARIAWNAAGLVDLGRMAVGVPVGGPVPDVAGHVVEAVPVRREGSDRSCRAIAAVRSPREIAVPEVGEPGVDGFRLITPGEDRLIQPATCRRFPLSLARQAPASPVRVRLGILVGDMDDRMISRPLIDDPLPSGWRQDAPGVQVHHRLMWRRFTGPAVRAKTIEPGCRFSSGAPGKSAGSSGRSATVT